MNDSHFRYKTVYPSPLGEITLFSDGEALTGLYFDGQRTCPAADAGTRDDLPVFVLTKAWLDLYFAGARPLFLPPLQPDGTVFQLRVWDALTSIPYGETLTDGALASALGSSPRAVGQAVGNNPISLLIPCHRVVGADGSLTGYAGGADRKAYLLRLEREGASSVVVRGV